MLDGLLGRGFAPKGKSMIKLTKSRIDVLRRKRKATIKFLKKDLADLLANGLDMNAYGRAGGLLDELRHLWNLDFVEKSCDFVYKHLSIMQKMRECPEACRGAVSSLMIAAAGFSELPELRDLRQIFHERYGDSLEFFVNQEFVENLSSKPFSLEKKVKLMEDVASEFSILWDSQAFEQKLSVHNVSVKDQPKKYGPLNATHDNRKSTNNNKPVTKKDLYDFSTKEKPETMAKSHANHFSTKERSEAEAKGDICVVSSKERSETMVNRCVYDLSSKARPEDSNDVHRLNGDKDENNGTATRGYRREFSSNERSENANNGFRSESKENEAEIKKFLSQPRQDLSRERHKSPYSIADKNFFSRNIQENGTDHEPLKMDDVASRPPRSNASTRRLEKVNDTFELYNVGESRGNTVSVGKTQDGLLKSGSKDRDPFHGYNLGGEYDDAKSTGKVQEKDDKHKPKLFFNNVLPPPYVKPNVKPKNDKLEAMGSSHADFDGNAVHDNGRHVFGSKRSNDHHHDRLEEPILRDDGAENSLPKRRSSRRRHSKNSSHDDFANPEDLGIVKRRASRSRRRENSRRGQQVLFDGENDQRDEEERMIDKLLMHYSKKPSCYEEAKVKSKTRSRHSHKNVDAKEGDPGSDDVLGVAPPPVRSISFPREQIESSESTRVLARAATFQPDRSSAARHVHPKLPDYDDLAARFAALKGR